MADIKVLKVNAEGQYQEHSEADDSIKALSFKTANHELTDAKLGELIAGGDASTQHNHDSLYHTKASFLDASAGAADAGKPIILDADGHVDASMINDADIDHGSLAGLGDDDHTIYTKADGTRAFTGPQSLGGNLLTDVAEPVSAQDAATKNYVDTSIGAIPAADLTPYLKHDGSVAMSADFNAGGFKLTNVANPSALTDAVNLQTLQAQMEGLKPKQAVRASTLAPIDLATEFEAGDILDGVTLVAGDRILVMHQADASDNGIYVVQASGAPVRALDFDSLTPVDEINGAYVPVSEGTVNAGKFFVQTGSVAVLETDAINFVFFNSAATISGGNGIDYAGNIISVDFLANAGLKFVGDELAVEPADFAGEGLIDDGSDNLAIDWSTGFADSKAIKASDLSSTANAKGASIIGIEDAAGNFAGGNVESALAELQTKIDAGELQVLYVAKNGNDANSGSKSKPFLTIAAANAAITDAYYTSTSDFKRYIIVIKPGVYIETAGFEWKNHVTYAGEGSRGAVSVSVASGDMVWNVPDVASPKLNFLNLAIFSPIVVNQNNASNLGVIESYHLYATAAITINNTGAASFQYQLKYSRLGAISTNGNVTGIVEFCTHNAITHGSASAITAQGSLFRRASVSGAFTTTTVNAASYYAYNSYADTTVVNDRGVVGAKDLIYTADSIRNNGLTVTGTFTQLRLTDVRNINYTPAVSGDWSVVPSEGKGALDELAARIKTAEADIAAGTFPIHTTDGVGVAKGDLVYFSAAGVVSKLSTITNNDEAAGLALETAGASVEVPVAAIDTVLTGVLSGAVAGARYYWDGSAYSTSMSTASGANVWRVGFAKNATDLVVRVQHVKKNP